ncbi:MAG: glycosyltransferase family 2 protein [Dehalococcoidia bacterium]
MQEPHKYPKISVLICALNEADNLCRVLPEIPTWVDEVVLVDGHSTDNTVEVAKALCPDIRIVHQGGQGKGDAIKCGVQSASGDIVVTLDADGATDPREMSKFVKALVGGFDFAKGSRLAHGQPPNMPRHRWLGNKVLTTTCNILHGTKYTDVCSGYNAFWKSAFLRLRLANDGFEMEQEMLVKVKRAELSVVEVEHHDAGRSNGVSKVADIRQGLVDLMVIIKERFRG